MGVGQSMFEPLGFVQCVFVQFAVANTMVVKANDNDGEEKLPNIDWLISWRNGVMRRRAKEREGV